LRAAIAGGGLQGVEAAYLASKAGWETLLIDRRADPPAGAMAGRTIRLDLLAAPERELAAILKDQDVIIPALEDHGVIARLAAMRAAGLLPPVAIDQGPYLLSASKPASKELFGRLGLPMAAPWRPGARGPFVAKPPNLSGSRGVVLLDGGEVERRFPDPGALAAMVVEERLDGPQYSIEVTARSGEARAWQATRLEMDELCGCRLVEAPADLGPTLAAGFAAMAETLAGALSLTGLMDLEAILHHGQLKLLEIDARLPSQTPMAVLHSTGVNLLVELAGCFLEACAPPAAAAGGPGRPKWSPGWPVDPPRRAVVEHVRLRNGRLTRHGEHIMTTRGPLAPRRDFLGADEALVAGPPDDLVATLIKVGPKAGGGPPGGPRL
jgi:pyrrolysine biosynthesis protein PylC